MRFYRIKQIEENKFIPQTADLFDYIFRTWEGIDREDGGIWYGYAYQKSYCACETLEEAREVIKKYKELLKTYKIKYHRP